MNDLFNFKLEVLGQVQVDRTLGVLAAKVKDLRPAWEDIRHDFQAREDWVFKREGAVSGWDRWRPLNPVYAAWKRKHGFGSKILVKTGRLKRSLVSGSPDTIFESKPKSMVVGTRVPYAKYHQLGTSKMPKREPIRLTEPQKRFWVQIIHKFLKVSGQFERANL